jgi:sulfite reductase alpha subunit-like flavoprotein
VFIVSTAGQGEMPDDMQRFWRNLMRKDIGDVIKGVRFTVFGLGDSGYPLFNAAARKLFQRLLNLGGDMVLRRGLGDDQDVLGYESELELWKKELWQVLHRIAFGNSECKDEVDLTSADLEVEFIEKSEEIEGEISEGYCIPFSCAGEMYTPISAKLAKNERITAVDHWQDVRHIEIDLRNLSEFEKSKLSYEPGDILLLHPMNDQKTVTDFLRDRLHLDPFSFVKISSKSEFEKEFPERIQLLELFCRHVDMLGIPKRSFFEIASAFASMEHEKEKLTEFASVEGQDDLQRYCTKERRTYIEVLCDFPSVQIPLSLLLEIVPRLQPRQFSISSSPFAHQGFIHITVALLEYQTPYKRQKVGICSNWIKSLEIGQSIPIWIRKGCISIGDPKSHKILIGPGTGIAPFRSMCHELDYLKHSNSIPIGKICVFFGNRNESKDFLYKDEWNALTSRNSIHLLSTAFSRDQPEKIYVQNRIREHASIIWELLQDSSTTIIIAGASGDMPRDVQDAIKTIVSTQTNCTAEESDEYLKHLIRRQRLILECWS